MAALEEMQLQMGFSQHALPGWAKLQIDDAMTGGKGIPNTELPRKTSLGAENYFQQPGLTSLPIRILV